MNKYLNRWARLAVVGGILIVANGCATHSLKDDVLDSNVVEFSKAQVCAEEAQKIGHELSAIECAKAYSAYTNGMGMVAYGSRVNIENVNAAEVSAHRANLELVERYGYLAATLGDAATTAKLKLDLGDESQSRAKVNNGTDARFRQEMQTRQYEAQMQQYRKNDVNYTGIPDPVGDNISLTNNGQLTNQNDLTANGGQGGLGGAGGNVGDINVEGSSSSSTSNVDPITNNNTAAGGMGGTGGQGGIGNGGNVGDIDLNNASNSASQVGDVSATGGNVGPINNTATGGDANAVNHNANSNVNNNHNANSNVNNNHNANSNVNNNHNANSNVNNNHNANSNVNNNHNANSNVNNNHNANSNANNFHNVNNNSGGCTTCEPDPSTPPGQWWLN
ncbi:MAG: hypothetical protein PHC51_07915 [bacterium]|nr:hypothetical protein [bacterium]